MENIFFVGANFDNQDVTEQFISENKWELGWQNDEQNHQYQKMLPIYTQIRSGDYLAIKSTYTKKYNLPFDNREQIISVMKIKAFGEVIDNLNDGHTLSVNWVRDFKEREWYFYVNQQTMWKLPEIDNNEKAKKLYYFLLNNEPQDYEWFMQRSGRFENQILESENIAMVDDYMNKLQSSKNIILRGAPGTGKTYLARRIAAEMIGCSKDDLNESGQFGFVQFHPNYDYTDFVEGIRPVKTDNDNIAFERRSGIFMDFCEKAKNSSLAGGKDNFDEVWEKYLEYINSQETKEYITKSSYLTVNSNHNLSVNYDSKAQGWSLPKKYVYELYKNPNYSQQTYYRGGGRTVIENMKNRFGLLNYIPPQETTQNKPFIFVIDEINRGDMAKIFGELFFSLDPGYRGKTGAVTTQFANLYDGSEGKVQGDKFYIPENVYIIGTMNDIDRSVDSFDFAMRRRFRFIEITAESQLEMLDSLGEQAEEAKQCLRNLNQKISETDELNANYHIGPSYFLKLKELDNDYDILWSDYLEPLLAEYLRGTYGEEDKLDVLKEAYHISVGEDNVANG